VFSDKTIFTIGKNSTLDIADYLYDESKPSKNKAKFNVLKGAFSSITGRIGKLNKSKFKLKTKSASIGIRGTTVKANQEVIMCTDGAITVTTNNGISMNVEAGQKTNVKSGVPTPPEEIQEGESESLGVESDENEEQSSTSEDAASSEISDIQNESNQIAVETRDLTLKGRTVDSQGKQQYVTVDITNIKDGIKVDEESGLRITDDLGNVVSESQNEDIVWGHWDQDTNKKWVAGQMTSVDTLNSLRDATNTVNASYNGKVMGNVNGTDNIKMDSTNSVNVNYTLGGGQNSMDGTMKFDTESGQKWNNTFSGTTTENTFSSNTVGGDAVSGRVDGAFYGKDANSIGGTFDLNNKNNDKATGVFKANKQ
jgi:hypothetical protein